MTHSRPLVLAVMCVGYFLVLLDVTVINVALPSIGRDLGAGVTGLQWVVDGYALALAALLLAGGTVGDARGHKPVVFTGLALFGAASLACGLAPTSGALIAARAAQGVGAALLLPGTLAIITRVFAGPAEQARAIGVWAGVGSVALAGGPLLGGALVDGIGWRWVFFLNVPIVAGAGLVAARVVPAAPPRGGRLDVPGTVLGALTLGATVFAVIEAGRDGPAPAPLVAAATAVIALAGFVKVERRAADPVLPLGLLRRPAFGTANAVAGAMNLGTLGLLFLLTLYLQTVQHRSPLNAGVALLPLFLPMALLAPLVGRVVARIGPRPVMVAGLLLAAAGTGLVAGWSTGTPYAALLPALLGWGVGLALLTPAVVAAAVAAVPADRTGLASGVNNTARQAGGAIGIAGYGALAGPAGPGAGYLSGMHAAGLVTAALYAAAALASALFVRPTTNG